MTSLILKDIWLKFPKIKKKLDNNISEHQTLKVNSGLKNINLNFKIGDKVGLIEENGADKTTLLKTIAGIYNYDSGSINKSGKILSVFSVNAGIESEFTGYENIFYQLYLRGLKKKQIDQKLENIIKFSKLGKNIFLPVRTYSNGMRARLAISIILSLEADIFICDEFITASDPEYFDLMINEIFKKYSKGIIIISSHYMEFLENKMNRMITMENGAVAKDQRINE